MDAEDSNITIWYDLRRRSAVAQFICNVVYYLVLQRSRKRKMVKKTTTKDANEGTNASSSKNEEQKYV
ncbi:hypothetical protein OROMI_016035 [Orobanche minor]